MKIIAVQRVFAADHGRFLAGYRRVESEPPLTAEVDRPFVPGAREHHPVHDLAKLVVLKVRHQIRPDDLAFGRQDGERRHRLRVHFVRKLVHYEGSPRRIEIRKESVIESL